MNPLELVEIAIETEKQGMRFLQLTMPIPKHWDKPHWELPYKVSTPFGKCKWVPSARGDKILIYPTIAQVKKYLKKAIKELENGH